MTPQRNTTGTLVDLLDRVLEKGLVIQADLIVSVAGIPLIGVNLRAALAGMETMLEYGVMQAWDENTRSWERENRKRKKANLLSGEEVLLKMRGSLHSSEGIVRNWQYGRFYLTSRRLILYHEGFDTILFETAFDQIEGLALSENGAKNGTETRRELHLLLEGNRWCRLIAVRIEALKQRLETVMGDAGCAVRALSAKERETCPQCGRLDLVRVLLDEGCAECGWTSPSKIKGIEALV
ncbi:MAG: gas vesicle protein [Deltaproteobacteria bacterium]|nr:gas vesicle protein [Deltaproteobacteria bacterium]